MPVILLLMLSVLATSCALVSGGPAPSESGPTTRELGEAMREVAERRQEVDDEVTRALAVLRRADDALAHAQRAPLVDQGLEEGRETREELDELAPEEVRAELRDLARRIDEARGLVASLRESTGDEATWRHRYLGSQDALLQALREHAAANDALVQLVARHRESYDAALAGLEEVADEREDHEDEAAAAAAVEEMLEGLEGSLRVARDELGAYGDRRRATGRRVNEAAADAATVLEQRTDG
jgi:chromosome segregation ATPase